MLSVRGRPHGYGGFFWFLWESQFSPNHQLYWQALLRCPTAACVDGAPWHLSTAATRSGRFTCHRRHSHRSPVAFIYLSPFLQGAKPPLCKGRWLPVGQTEGLSLSLLYNPPVSSADSPLYTRGPFPVPTIILQITMLLFVKGRRLYCGIYFSLNLQ